MRLEGSSDRLKRFGQNCGVEGDGDEEYESWEEEGKDEID
jgi:hypothetical protein